MNKSTDFGDYSKSDAQKFNDIPKYQKSSYDDKQLPPIEIDYKRCHRKQRTLRKYNSSEKRSKSSNMSISRNHSKHSMGKKVVHNKHISDKKDETDIHEYQKLILDKELILSKSRYTKVSPWAQYLKNSVKDYNSQKLSLSSSALDLFNAYKVSNEIDKETMQQHLQLAKEIEKKRRNEREKIHRRLAIGTKENFNELDGIWSKQIQTDDSNHFPICHINGISSDTESHSSDSETCPKLSKIGQQCNIGLLNISLKNKSTHLQNNQQSSSDFASTNRKPEEELRWESTSISKEDKECEFFTKQAKFQLEARMALIQAKEMAHIQMKVERQNRCVSPITQVIQNSLVEVGSRMCNDKRRVSRHMLTSMNIAQLQVLVDNFHLNIKKLNESLVQMLMERDDLHMEQDLKFSDVEQLTQYMGAKEHATLQNGCFFP